MRKLFKWKTSNLFKWKRIVQDKSKLGYKEFKMVCVTNRKKGGNIKRKDGIIESSEIIEM